MATFAVGAQTVRAVTVADLVTGVAFGSAKLLFKYIMCFVCAPFRRLRGPKIRRKNMLAEAPVFQELPFMLSKGGI